MPDITMCQNSECLSADYCERFTAKPNKHRQSYAYFCGADRGWVKCGRYIPNEKGKTFDILANDVEPTDDEYLSRLDFQAMGTGLKYSSSVVVKLTKRLDKQ